MKSVTSLKHSDTRLNIPTEELRDFVAEEEKTPKAMLYPRDPSLDPQLVWKGKDDQDGRDLEVPTVPIYIQEKIHPQAIIEDLRAQAKQERPAAQMDLFSDFNGIEDFDKKVDFYHHEQHWSNRMILGDSLLVMNSLAEKEGLKGKVQMIFMDPPYGIKFGSNWQVSTRKRDVKDGSAADLTRQPEQVKAFRDTWELGIHSYLAYLRDRLVLARELLTESGSIFIQIGDENQHLVRCVLDEVFGSENFVSLVSFRTTSSLGGDYLGKSCDYLVWYARDLKHLKYRPLFKPRGYEDDAGGRYSRVQLAEGVRRVLTTGERADISLLPTGSSIYRHDNLTSQSGGEFSRFPVSHHGRTYVPNRGFWKTNTVGMTRLNMAGRLAAPTANSLAYVRFLQDFPLGSYSNVWTDTQTGAFTDPKVYAVQTNTKVIERCLLMTTDPGDLVLDPTCGSGTTAYVAEEWGRRWITTDTSRVALALARTRLMAGRFPFYFLADTPEGVQKETEVTGHAPASGLPQTGGDIKKGFVYKRVPHITLKSIANNEDIDQIHARWEIELGPLRSRLNQLLNQKWEEWQVPPDADPKWLAEAKETHAHWWELRRERQQEIDASIARRAETEILYDQPYEDPKRVRVTGPFTVESLSPHRTLSVDEKIARSDGKSEALPGVTLKVLGPDTFGQTVIENLKKAGIQNTKKGERLKFDILEPYPGEWLQAAGEYTDATGNTKRVGISIGPEHGTVGAELVKQAAKEAVRGEGFDLLVICGFAFDAGVYEEARRFGKLTVLMSKMNPDLAMGDDLLKKTGAGNLFMVFGEPDIAVEREKDGRVVLEIKGLDIYDPTTGEIRSSSTDDIACWFLDTDYNEESFFVRHAYFTGAQEPYEKLKRALRAEIDEAAWASLYSTRSRPFDPPKSGKVAVKVINHYGDEVMKVFCVT